MVRPKPVRELLITKHYPSSSPGSELHRGISGLNQPLPLSPTNALDLIIATSGLFRDYVGNNV